MRQNTMVCLFSPFIVVSVGSLDSKAGKTRKGTLGTQQPYVLISITQLDRISGEAGEQKYDMLYMCISMPPFKNMFLINMLHDHTNSPVLSNDIVPVRCLADAGGGHMLRLFDVGF